MLLLVYIKLFIYDIALIRFIFFYEFYEESIVLDLVRGTFYEGNYYLYVDATTLTFLGMTLIDYLACY
jgi:hypothetical protein